MFQTETIAKALMERLQGLRHRRIMGIGTENWDFIKINRQLLVLMVLATREKLKHSQLMDGL